MAPSFQIMLITDEEPCLVERVERAFAQPTRVEVALQLRRKLTPLDELRTIARELRDLTRGLGIPLLINGRVDVALDVEADGVHLPAHGVSLEVARLLLPAHACLGVSCHTKAEIERVTMQGAADYAVLSPIRAVPGKAPPLGIEGFGAALGQRTLPVLALGGITLDDVSPLRSHGAAGIAVMRSVLSAADPAFALAALCARWDGVRE